MVGIWLLCMVVLVNAYSGVLTSLLTVPKLEPIARTLKEVVESDTLRVTVERASIFAINFLVLFGKTYMLANLIVVELFIGHFIMYRLLKPDIRKHLVINFETMKVFGQIQLWTL